MAKLAETTYRDVNIGLANQFARYADTAGIDVARVIEACNSQPYSHIHRPGIAVGGHCIPVYPRLYLAGDPDATVVSTARAATPPCPPTRSRGPPRCSAPWRACASRPGRRLPRRGQGDRLLRRLRRHLRRCARPGRRCASTTAVLRRRAGGLRLGRLPPRGAGRRRHRPGRPPRVPRAHRPPTCPGCASSWTAAPSPHPRRGPGTPRITIGGGSTPAC